MAVLVILSIHTPKTDLAPVLLETYSGPSILGASGKHEQMWRIQTYCFALVFLVLNYV